MRSPTIIIAEDHPISLQGMETILKKKGFTILGAYTNGLQAYNQIINEKPDYVLLDVQMPGLSGVDITEKLKEKGLLTKIIIYTMYTNASIFERAKQLGVDGYLLKEFALDDLEICVSTIQKGKKWYHPQLEERLKKNAVTFSPELYASLTIRERNILACIADDKSTKQIAEEQFLSEKTIESHRRNIVKKLKLPSKKNALLIWVMKNRGFFAMMD